MSYTFLLERGAESSAECFSDIEPFVRSRLNHTAEKSCCNANRTGSCPGSRSGMTCEPSTADRGAESSTSSAGGSPVKTSAQPEKVQGSTANGPDCGPRWPGSLARYDPDSRSWRTRQCLLLGGLEEFSETFPRWGSMRDGELFRQPTPVLRTCGKESGFWPTPVSSDTCNRNTKYAQGGTPLSYAVRLWPTPKNRDWKGATNREKGFETVANLDGGDGKPIGGSLNLTWVEWLMGWPIEWTALRPLEMARFRQWRHSHGEFWRG